MLYSDELTKAMTMLGEDEDTIFLGQGVTFPGHSLYKTLSGVPPGKRIEMPVVEDMQMGISIGLALTGRIPITIYPRFDFLMCAMNQLVNHLDKIRVMSHGEYNPHVIIRVAVGATNPLYPGPQHVGDYTWGLLRTLNNVEILTLRIPQMICPAYRYALTRNYSVILVEYCDKYGDEK